MLALLLLVCLNHGATATATTEGSVANPIRRVVNMLQMMQAKVTAEGEKQKVLFEKFMCYCTNGKTTLQDSIKDAETKIPQLTSDLGSAAEEKKQLDEDIPAHKADRDAAKAALKEAKAAREKEAAAFAKESAEAKATLDAATKAIVAIEKGMAGGFLQTEAAATLRKALANIDLGPDRDAVAAFLSQGQGYAPASGQIVGILKQMVDTMQSDLKDSTAAEEKAIAGFEALAAAKTKEINALQKQVEEKTARVGEMGVEVTNMAEDLDDTKDALVDDKKFLKDLDKNCATKQEEWDVICKTRAEELLALADTIKILNDDDALDLFKKTLPSPSLLQVQVSTKEVVQRARETLRAGSHRHDYRVDLITLALQGKKVNFDKVLKMIDEMVGILGAEQEDDNAKKAYCEKEFDESEDEQKELLRKGSKLDSAIKKGAEAVATLTEEIAALGAGISKLDKQVSEATEQRKEEHSDYEEALSSNKAALEILGMAKNRMNKFYNPKLYKAESFAQAVAPTLVQVSAHATNNEAPPPPPEAVGAYQKKGGESTGCIAMMDTLAADLAKEMQESKVEEENAQEEYEQFVADSAEKRTDDSKLLEEKEGVKAEEAVALNKNKHALHENLKEEMANDKVISDLHGECDWIIANFETRKKARVGEIDAMKKAKAVLSGADYSLVQKTVYRLRRSVKA